VCAFFLLGWNLKTLNSWDGCMLGAMAVPAVSLHKKSEATAICWYADSFRPASYLDGNL
jgi:hypothetical protein